ncbi:MAG: hypothetical protein V4732_13395 [Pseudomonadota bacterium]
MSSVPVKTIAGLNAGIRVTLKYDLFPLYNAMKERAKAGNHWARICVNELESLSSGHVKNNVYVQGNGRHEEFGEYSVILPGCRASFRKNNTGAFYIYSLEVDGNFTELQRDKKKPGLYNVKKDNKKWNAELETQGKIKERKNNLVTISDQINNVDFAAILAPQAMTESGRATTGFLESNGFDLHFTPGKKRIGGLANLKQAYNAETDASLHESAILLAGTMESARNIKDVTWVSERGGSGVLTQAMRILKERGVNFSASGHKAFFSNLQTNLGNAEGLARNIGIGFDGKSHSKEMINVNQLLGSGLFGGFVNPVKRFIKDDKYSALNCISDMGKEAGSHKELYGKVTGAAGVVLGLKTAGVGLGTAMAVATGPGATFAAAVAAVGASAALYKGLNAVTKSYFPLASHKKLTGE